jgi:hypothetical protein
MRPRAGYVTAPDGARRRTPPVESAIKAVSFASTAM